MDFKLLACLLACLVVAQQADANCLGQAEHLFETRIEIPQFAKEIEAVVHEIYPKAEGSLLDLMQITVRCGKHVAAYFDAPQLASGTEQCEKFTNSVHDLLVEAGCDQGLNDADELLEVEDGWARNLPEITKVLGYVEACNRVTT